MTRAEEVTPLSPSASELAVPVAILAALVVLAYLAMWWGWRRRARRHDLPELPPVPAEGRGDVLLAGEGRYFGTTVAGRWLERVTARGLGPRSQARLTLSPAGVDVTRPGRDFHIPAGALQGARQDQGIAGKVVPPHGVLVVTWRHGEHLLDSGFRLHEPDAHERWVRAIDELAGSGRRHDREDDE